MNRSLSVDSLNVVSFDKIARYDCIVRVNSYKLTACCQSVVRRQRSHWEKCLTLSERLLKMRPNLEGSCALLFEGSLDELFSLDDVIMLVLRCLQTILHK